MLNIDKKFIGNQIRVARKKLKMSQFELAEKSDLHEKQISRIEAGENSPSLENFLKIVQVLNIKLEYFSGLDIPQNIYTNEFLKILKTSTEKELELYIKIIKTLKNY